MRLQQQHLFKSELVWLDFHFVYVIESSEASFRDPKQYSRTHHRLGATGSSEHHYSAVTRSHGGQTVIFIPKSLHLLPINIVNTVRLDSDVYPLNHLYLFIYVVTLRSIA